MGEPGGGFDLPEESFRPQCGGQFRPQHLDRHLAVVFDVLGEVHRGHAAGTNLPLDDVAVGEGGFESVEDVCHVVLARVAALLGYDEKVRAASPLYRPITCRIHVVVPADAAASPQGCERRPVALMGNLLALLDLGTIARTESGGAGHGLGGHA